MPIERCANWRSRTLVDTRPYIGGIEKLRTTRPGDKVCLAIPGKIVELFSDQPHFAVVEVSGVKRKVNVDLVRDEIPLAISDWVLIHVGFAMSRISAEHADEQMRLLTMLGEADQAMTELEGYQFS